jgi:Tfp pilus assembly protein PilV
MIAERPRRPGFGLIEMAVTGVLIVVAMAVTIQVIGWIALERKAVERRERALLEAENVLEHIAAIPYADLSTESTAKLRPSSSAGPLRDPVWKVEVISIDEAPARKKIVIEVCWPDRSGRSEAPVRLVAWVYPRRVK